MCKSRRVPAIAVGVSSIVVFLLGVAMIVLSLLFNFKGFQNLDVFTKYKNVAFIILIIGSVLAVVTSILSSIVACKQRHWCCNVNVGIFMFFSWVLLLAAGITMGSISLTKEQTFINFCDKDYVPNGAFGKGMKKIIEKVDDQIGSQVSNYMCSLTCPCSIKDNKVNMTQWTLMTDTELASFGRA